MNRGIIPRDVDLTPAFERGQAPLNFTSAPINLKSAEKPAHLRTKVQPGPIKYLRRKKDGEDELPDPNIIPDASLHRDNVFLTSMNVEDHDVLKSQGLSQKAADRDHGGFVADTRNQPFTANNTNNLISMNGNQSNN